jgi:hypothetical protein
MSDQLAFASLKDEAFRCASETELLSKGTSAGGLSDEEAVRRLRAIGPIAILIIAAIVSAAVGDFASGATILARKRTKRCSPAKLFGLAACMLSARLSCGSPASWCCS